MMPYVMAVSPLFSFIFPFILTVLLGLAGLPLLRRLQLRQTVREDGPKSHYVKSGTPTFGALFFLPPLILGTIILMIRHEPVRDLLLMLLLTLSYAAVGIIDDYIKVKVDKKGLSVRQKTILLTVFAVLFAVYFLFISPDPVLLRLPFAGQVIVMDGWLKPLYFIFTIVFIFFISNSVNLTDGVDGLAGSVTLINTLALALYSWKLADQVAAAGAAGHFALLIAGGCLGFLVFNWHPARVFMGDGGSQALGAALAVMTLLLGIPWILLAAGFIYIIESLSVIIQVAYFKKTGGRRIFRMSPIHHHYELGGWSEIRIVLTFSLVSLVACAVGWLLI